jgi:lactate permease
MESQNLPSILLSLLPIAALITLIALRVRIVVASFIGFAISAFVGLLYMKTSVFELGLQVVKGCWNALGIFWVIAPAMLIFQILKEADMFNHIKSLIDHSINSEMLKVMFAGWIFASFLQSVTGFGVPVAVCAPILMGFGFSPVKSVIIAILGHAWGGTYGTLAIAWDSLLLQADVTDPPLAAKAAIFACLMLWGYNLICGLAIYMLYIRNSAHKKIAPKELFAVVELSAVKGGGQLVAASFNPSVACFVASALSIAAVFVLDKSLFKTAEIGHHSGQRVPLRDIVMPYTVLTAIVAVLLLLKPVNHLVSQIKIGLMLPMHIGGEKALFAPISIFTHSGSILLATAAALYFYYLKKGYIKRRNTGHALSAALSKACQSILPVLCLISMSKVMDGSGQIAVLSKGTAAVLGGAYPLVAPLVGILGAFLCSSNMSSNILFAGFQYNIAHTLNIAPSVLLAAQTAGGSIGNLLATSNIVTGLIVTKHQGKEREVMRLLFPICIGAGIACGLFSFLLI